MTVVLLQVRALTGRLEGAHAQMHAQKRANKEASAAMQADLLASQARGGRLTQELEELQVDPKPCHPTQLGCVPQDACFASASGGLPKRAVFFLYFCDVMVYFSDQ